MKTIKFFAAAVAVLAVFSCKQPSVYEKMKADVEKDAEVAALEPTSATIDSVSYLLGVNYGMMFKGNGFFDEASEVNMDELKKGIEDAMTIGDPTVMYGVDSVWMAKFKVSPYDMNQVLNSYITARQAYKAKFNEKLGAKFLADNKANTEVKETESGLQYILHAEGEGDKVGAQDTVVVNYKGTLIDGTEFDANESTQFIANRVIKGWTEGLSLLGKGGKATFYIPSELAYGERGTRGIEPNSTLIFEVEVLDVMKFQEPAEVAE